jgi:hypothetical protein
MDTLYRALIKWSSAAYLALADQRSMAGLQIMHRRIP